MFDPRDLDPTTGAYHEAGHVLMAHILGGQVMHVTMESDDDNVMGMTTVHWHSLDATQHHRCSALVALAGPVAETIWRGDIELLESLTAWHADWQEVKQALTGVAKATNEAEQLRQWLNEVTSQFREPHHWERLCRIADALEAHGTLDDDLLDDVLGRD